MTHETLLADRFAANVAVSGHVTIAADGLGVSAWVTATLDGGRSERLHIVWDGGRLHALATVTGPGPQRVVPAP